MKKEFLLLYQKIGNDIVGSASRDFSEKMRLEIEQEPVEAELEKAKDLLKRVAQKMTNKDEKKQTISEARKIAREKELKGRELGEKELTCPNKPIRRSWSCRRHSDKKSLRSPCHKVRQLRSEGKA